MKSPKTIKLDYYFKIVNEKLYILFILFVLNYLTIEAQIPPTAFNYSAVARNAQNNPIVNASIGIQVSILKASTTGSVQYVENHIVNTDQFGLFNLIIGAGVVQSGNINSIDWSIDKYFLKIGMDLNGGTNFINMGTTQLLSVPYALYAKSAGSIANGGSNGGGVVDSVIGTPIFIKGNGVTDIDGNQYPTVIIGNQEWMASNLKTSKFRNGDTIPLVSDSVQWASIWNNSSSKGTPAWCYYDNKSSYNNVYGKLYNWYAANDTRNICPIGWHLPSENEWNELVNFIDIYNISGGRSSEYAGGAMKKIGILQTQKGIWRHPNEEATNVSGFSAVPTGLRNQFGVYGDLNNNREIGYWWSSTQNNSSQAMVIFIQNVTGYTNTNDFDKAFGFSVRCLKD